MLTSSEETEKEFARVANENYRSAKEHFNKDTRASDKFVEWASEFKVQ